MPATLTLSLGAFSKSKTIQDADVTRVQTDIKAFLHMPSATNAQAFDALADWVFRQIITACLNVEKGTASDGITDISLT